LDKIKNKIGRKTKIFVAGYDYSQQSSNEEGTGAASLSEVREIVKQSTPSYYACSRKYSMGSNSTTPKNDGMY